MEACTEGWVQGAVGGRGSPLPHPNWKPLKIFMSPKKSLKLIFTFAGTGLLHLSSFYPIKAWPQLLKTYSKKNLETFFFSFKIIEKQTNSLRVSLGNICWQVHRSEPVRVELRRGAGGGGSLTWREWGRKGTESHCSCPSSLLFLLEESKSSDLHRCGSLVTWRPTDHSSLPAF